MTLRRRLVVVFALVAVLPVVLLGVALRFEIERRVTAGHAEALDAEAVAVAGVLSQASRRIAGQLSALSVGVDDDNRLRRALLRDAPEDARYRLEYAGRVLPLTGLALLRLVDAEGSILSSGHFPGEAGTAFAGLGALRAADPDAPVVLEARTPSGPPFTTLVRLDSVRMGARTIFVLGGIGLDSAALTGLPAARAELDRGPGAGDAALERTAVALPVVGDTTGEAGTARLVVIGDPAPLEAALRRLDRALLGVLVGVGFLAVLVAQMLANRISRPVARLADQARSVDPASLDVVFTEEGDDEVSQLAGVLGAMVARLREDRRQLADAERRATIGDLSRQVNHDIKNGLTPIRNVLSHLDEVAETAPADVGRVFLERRHTLESSVTYLDDLARNVAGLTPDVVRRRCDINAVIRDVARGRAADPLVRLELEAGDPAITADPLTVRRVLKNLVDNATDSAGPGGAVTVSGRANDAVYRVVVADDGPGMTERQLEQAFNEWYTTKPSGTGLGLPIVRRLVLDLGGVLRVETQPGHGTRVTVELPLRAGPEKEAP